MRLLRRPAFLAAVAMSVIVGLYFVLVAGRAVLFIAAPEPMAKALGVALFVLPVVGVWWLAHEWRLGTTVQRMASVLEEQGRLPIHDGDVDAHGRLTQEAQDAVFEVSRRNVEMHPDDWAAWFHVAYAYDAARDRQMARKSLRHAALLFKAERRRAGGDVSPSVS